MTTSNRGVRESLGRKRTTNMNLPLHMKARKRSSGTYFYYFNGTKELPLGKDYVAAVAKWAELESGNAKLLVPKITFRFIAEKYFQSESYKAKAPRTQKDYLRDVAKLYEYFDNPPAPVDEIEPHHIALYRDWRKSTHSTQELGCFSAIWANAKEKGYTKLLNPASGIKRNRGAGRDVYVDDELFNRVYEKADQPTRDAMDLAWLAGQRPGDSLRFKETDIREGALWVHQGKTSARVRIEITGRLAEVIERIKARKAATPGIRSLALVVNERGLALSASALDNRFEAARRAAGVELNSFQFRDLRAKAATETEEQIGMEAAQNLLGHKSSGMTAHYVRNRKGKLVKPTR